MSPKVKKVKIVSIDIRYSTRKNRSFKLSFYNQYLLINKLYSFTAEIHKNMDFHFANLKAE